MSSAYSRAGHTFKEDEDGDSLMKQAFESAEPPPDQKITTSEIKNDSNKQKKTKPPPSEGFPDDEVDLHGKTREEAVHIVQNFIRTAHLSGFNTLLIITGKGQHSGSEGPVLRRSVEEWLKRNGKPYLNSFQTAPLDLGGEGAIVVYLK